MIRHEIDMYLESHEDGLLPFLHLLLFGMNILYSQLLLIVLATSILCEWKYINLLVFMHINELSEFFHLFVLIEILE
jgi:hypothetical protein